MFQPCVAMAAETCGFPSTEDELKTLHCNRIPGMNPSLNRKLSFAEALRHCGCSAAVEDVPGPAEELTR